ncbi:hypothetical protein [Chitinophaga nivalis]|uniref:Uncharacterized protein n=1 Tax=Chitinophaga nivalis TaxID=2991709 RepID=A0ABT3IIB2_9BACT|nr:hypothetical protein [Chitinophaga nivalis]MCW3466635.1 hypothetical protein [Chitinophaga nivalis]MCW3483674.1 hypothetical protein [Chitinophaga nivalis]
MNNERYFQIPEENTFASIAIKFFQSKFNIEISDVKVADGQVKIWLNSKEDKNIVTIYFNTINGQLWFCYEDVLFYSQ